MYTELFASTRGFDVGNDGIYRFTSIVIPSTLSEDMFLGFLLYRNRVDHTNQMLDRKFGKNKGMVMLRLKEIPIMEGLREGGRTDYSFGGRYEAWHIGLGNGAGFLARNEVGMLYIAGNPYRFARSTIGANVYLIVYAI